MKKFILLFLAAVVMLTATSCMTNPPVKKVEKINVSVLKGPSGIGAARLMEQNDNNECQNSYNFMLFGSPDEVSAKIISGETDIAAVPSNLAAVLYNKLNGEVRAAALGTLGVLYILENGDTINTVEDLRGKTLYATAKGSMPEYVLNYILIQNGIDPEKDLIIEYKTEHAELAALMTLGEATLAMLPEPFVTTTMMNNENVRVALNLTEEWDKAAANAGIENSVLSQTVILVRAEFLENNKEAFDVFLDEYKASVEYANENIDETAALCEAYEIIPKAGVARRAIPNCNIVFIEGQDMADTLKNLYNVLFEADAKSLGGALPDDIFYYKR